jgi:ferredoxin, 2Fe-2S
MDSTAKIILTVYQESTGSEILHSINPQDDRALLEVLLEIPVAIDHSCGGNGTCGTCRVQACSPKGLSERSEIETEMAADRGMQPDERLACQSYLVDSVRIKIP